MPAVRADDEIGVDRDRSPWRLCDEAVYSAVPFAEAGDLGLHQQVERRVRARVRCDEVEKVPLRHQRDELAVRRQVREVAERERLAPDATGDVPNLTVRSREEFVEHAELVEDLERG